MIELTLNKSLFGTTAFVSALCFFSSVACADFKLDVPASSNSQLEEVLIIGSDEKLKKLAGSASRLDEENLKTFAASDINDVLTQVPGVYIRYEDGYGLRPNIGIRGVTSDRSQKITLMEDGLLIGPSPYSAPAAYYFPNVGRMQAVEVVKGPAAIENGPHTIGGSMNMVTRGVPLSAEGGLDVVFGSDNYQSYSIWYGDSIDSGGGHWGYLVDAMHYGADGFKQLDNGGGTGFTRNDVNLKLQWRSQASASMEQKLQLKLGYADENSNETYLGVSDADFARTPQRRYAASQLDHFVSEHSQVQLLYSLDSTKNWRLFSRGYSHDFHRSWEKFDGFMPVSDTQVALPAQVILSQPDLFPNFMSLLRGEIDTGNNPYLLLDVTDNDRNYGSHGLELKTEYDVSHGGVNHVFSLGARFHHDYVERDHQPSAYAMASGTMLLQSEQRYSAKSLNKAATDALAIYLSDEISVGNLTVNVGARYEGIEGTMDDDLSGSYHERSQNIVTPGLGMHYQWREDLGLLAGVYRGFSPAAPSADVSVEPEEAINYEYGLRFQRGAAAGDVIGFFSDYSNLIGRCRASDSGCEPGDEFNGGEVEVAGLELTVQYDALIGSALSAPVSVVYTYTESAFQSAFQSGFSQWGTVQVGDALPYLPEHQLRFQAGLQTHLWTFNLAVKYVDEMREIPGSEKLIEGYYTPAYTTFDLAAAWRFSESLELKLIGENLTEEQVIVSRRPYGARPNQPRFFKLAFSWQL